MTKAKFLKLLDDEEIQNKIKKIVTNNIVLNDTELDKAKEEIEVLTKLVEKWKSCFSKEESKNGILHEEVNIKEKELLQLNSKIESAKAELNTMKTKLSKSNDDNHQLASEIEKYKKQFDEDLDMFNLYKNFSNETKSSLKGIFKNDTFEGFMACGLQEKNIHSLWDYIKSELIENSNQDNENLVKIFNFFFLKYEMAYPMYKAQDIENDEAFNTDLHIKDSQSFANGKIKKVLLKGWINSKTNSVIRKSLVNF